MSLTGLQQILNGVQEQPKWRLSRQFLAIVQHWTEVVGETVAAQTQPTGMYRQVLQVAVSNSVWAQALAFERQNILAKLTPLVTLGTPIIDIHFSTAKWASLLKADRNAAATGKSPMRPILKSGSGQSRQDPSPPIPQDPVEAFQRLSAIVKQKTAQLPRCPRCRCATSPVDLERWRLCHLCAGETLFG